MGSRMCNSKGKRRLVEQGLWRGGMLGSFLFLGLDSSYTFLCCSHYNVLFFVLFMCFISQ